MIRTGVLCINMQLTVITAVCMVWYRDSCDVKTMMMMISFEVNERLGWCWWYSFKRWNRGWGDDDDFLLKCEGGAGMMMMMMILFEVKERLGWVEETMEEAIKGLETLTVIISHPFFFSSIIVLLCLWMIEHFYLTSAKDVVDSCKPEVRDGNGGWGWPGKVISTKFYYNFLIWGSIWGRL